MAPGRIKRIIKANRKIFADYRQGAAAGGGVRGGISAAAGNLASSPLALLAQAVKKPSSMFWKGLTGSKSILGINVGVGAFLKQSQIFNTFVTSILQIIGALIDVAIAPFIIPFIVPLAKKMGSWVPKISEYAKSVAAEAIPKIKAMAQDIWNGDGNWLTKSIDIVSGVLEILWGSSGLEKWWNEQTGSLGVFLNLIEGVGKFIRAHWRLIEFATRNAFKITKRITEYKEEGGLGKLASDTFNLAKKSPLSMGFDVARLVAYLFRDADTNSDAAANTLPPPETLNKDMYDRMGATP